jgi:glycosyltransferase involved in cell wall biosynthesis
MRILFVPLDNFNLNSNEHIPSRIRLLSRKNKLVGVTRKAVFTRGMPGFSAYIKFFAYSARVFFYGLKHRKEYDLIYCFSLNYTLAGDAISIFTGKPCVRGCAGTSWEWVHRVKASPFFRMVIFISEKVAKLITRLYIVQSDADRKAYIEHGYDSKKVVVVRMLPDFKLINHNNNSNRSELRRKLKLDTKSRILIFSGKQDYPPNMDAVEWICGTLAPALAAKFDDVQILLTGGGRKPEFTHPIVTYTGFVPDLFEYISAADVYIAPIEMPSGRLTKVFDSLSCKTPTVVLASATNGIPELVDGRNAMIAANGTEFIEKTIYLLEHPSEAKEIGIRGYEMLVEHYKWDFWEDKMNRALASCLNDKTKKRGVS